MGAAASSLQQTGADLTPEEKGSISVSLKQQYEYCLALEMSDDLIQDTLIGDYHKCLQKIRPDYEIPSFVHVAPPKVPLAPPIKAADKTPTAANAARARRGSKEEKDPVRRNSFDGPTGGAVPTRRSSKQNFEAVKQQAPVSSKLKKGGRRKSFDGGRNQPAVRNKEILDSIISKPTGESGAATTGSATDPAVAAAAAALGDGTVPNPDIVPPPAAVELDSWDSVQTQPYCNTCAMAFKTPTLLDKHLKYSDIHAYNVKKKDKQDKVVTHDPTLPIPANNDQTGKQVEGSHYKLLYHGSKMFWKNQMSYEIHMYHHILPHTIEVIGFDGAGYKEQPRLYLDYVDTVKNFKEEMDKALNEKVMELSNDRFATIDKDAVQDELERNSLTNFVLSRLKQKEVEIAPGHMNYVGLGFKSWESDACKPLRAKIPVTVVPVWIPRRRTSTTDEINDQIHAINQDIKIAKDNINRAEKIANIVDDTAKFLSTKKWWKDVEFSKLKLKWIRAIKMVIRIQNKSRIIARLKQLGVEFVLVTEVIELDTPMSS